jgi:hypothetical protein
VTNTPAYYGLELITTLKRFIVQALGLVKVVQKMQTKLVAKICSTECKGATTFSITTFGITTLSIATKARLSIATLSIYVIVLGVIFIVILSVVLLSVVMLSVVILSVVMLSVVAPRLNQLNVAKLN